MKTTIRVLIAEDSVFIQKILVKILTSDPAIQVVGVAGNGKMAVDMTRALAARRHHHGHPHAGHGWVPGHPYHHVRDADAHPGDQLSPRSTTKTCASPSAPYSRGRSNIMEKPRGHLSADYLDVGREIVRKLKLIADIKVFPPHRSGARRPLLPIHLPSSSSRYPRRGHPAPRPAGLDGPLPRADRLGRICRLPFSLPCTSPPASGAAASTGSTATPDGHQDGRRLRGRCARSGILCTR